MSTVHIACLMVGLPFAELAEVHGVQEIKNDLDGGMECGSYSYDSSPEDNVVGFIICQTDSIQDVDESIIADVLHYKSEFRIKYDMEPKVFLTMYVF